MAAAPWIQSIIGDFGRAAGLESLALDDRGAAMLDFEDGRTLSFEYSGDMLAVSMTHPARLDASLARTLLAYSHPAAAFPMRVRAGYLARKARAILSVGIPERDLTLPALNQAFSLLWRLTQENGGAKWA